MNAVINLLNRFADWFIASCNRPRSTHTRDDMADAIDGILAGENQKGDGNVIYHERNGWRYSAHRTRVRSYYRRRS